MRDTPEIRFKGFDDEWQEKKLDDLGIIISGFGFPKKEQGKKEGIPFYKISDMADPENNPIMVTASNYVGENQISRNSWDVIDLNPSIIFAKVGAAINLNRKRLALTPFLIDNNMMSFSSSSMDGNFMLTLFENIYLPKYSQVGAIPSYNDKIIGKVDVNIPDFNEQNQIGKLFARLNKLIKLKGKEIEKLEAYKNSMMENMFPQRGEDIPRIRFNGFEKAWNYLKLKDIYSISGSGGTPSTNNKSYYGGNIPFLSISDISEKGGRINKTEKNITKLGLNNSTARIFPKNTICLAMYASVGKVTVAGTPLATSQAFYNMYFENINTTKFVFQYLKYFNEIGGWIKYVSTGTQANLNAYKIKNFDIPIPSLEEQKLIGNFFYKLDKHIELKKDELEKLKEFKAALLDKMFV